MEAALDVGQPDADDGVVEEGQEEDAAEGGQGQRLRRRAEAAGLDGQAGDGAVSPGGATGDGATGESSGAHLTALLPSASCPLPRISSWHLTP